MTDTLLGIDVGADTVTVVQAKRGLRGCTVTGCASAMITGEGGINKALVHISQQVELKADACISTITSGQISFHNLRI